MYLQAFYMKIIWSINSYYRLNMVYIDITILKLLGGVMKKRVLSFLLAFVVLFQIIQPTFATEVKAPVAEDVQENVSENKETSKVDEEKPLVEENSEKTEDKKEVEQTQETKVEDEKKSEEDEKLMKPMALEQAATAEEKTLTILHVNDTHGRYNYEEGKVIGYPKARTIIDQYKANGPTIALDSGDATHGTNFATLSQGESIVKLLDLAGFSAIVPGNHDFNYGKDRLIELSSMGTNLKYISANIKKTDSGENLLPAYEIFDVDGIKVGVFGLSTPETVYKSHPNNTRGLNFDDVVNSAKNSIEELKAQGAQAIILLSHLGTDQASEVNTFTLLDQLSNKSDIDVVIDGHSHSLYENGYDYNGTFIASTGYHFQNMGVTTITFKADGSKVEASKMLNVAAPEVVNAEANQDVAKLIAQYEGENQEILSQVIGNTATELDGARPHVRTRETNLADLITDSMRLATGADAVITNGGGIRNNIDAGEITMGEALEVLPFGNLVTVIEVTGQNIVDALKHGASDYPNPKGAFPQVSGLEYTIDISSDQVEIKDVKIGGNAIDLAKTYRLATNDFMAVGGDDYKMFEGAKQVSLHGSMLEIFADYLTKLSKDGAFTAKTDGRIKVFPDKPETLELPVNNMPNRLIATFKGDTKSRRAFNWYTTDKLEDSEVLISKDSSMSAPMKFTPEIEEVKSMYFERAKDGRFLYRALKDGKVIAYFTDEKVEKIDQLEQVAKDLGADTYDFPNRNEVTEHVYKALATGLEANTKYYYKVGSQSQGYSEVGSFVTSGESGDKFEFLHYTDTQNYWQNEKLFDEAWYGADTIRKALATAPEASFVVHTGDIVEQAIVEDEWNDIFEQSKDSFLKTTIAPNAGNHDEYGSSTKEYNPETKEYKTIYDEGDITLYNRHVNVEAANGAVTGGSYYSYDFNGMHFVSLNTNDYKEDGKAIGQEQLAWIKKDVEEARANGAKWVVLNYHKPLFSKSYHSLQDSDVMAVKEEFMKLIDDLDIDLALQGHDHVISRTKSLVYATKEESPFFGKVAEEAQHVDGIDHYTNPKGTTFILPNTGGTKAYDDIYNKGIDHLRMVRPKIAKYLDEEATNRNKSAEDLIKEYESLFAFGGQPSQPEEFKTSHSNNRDSVSQNFARYIVEADKLTVMLYQINGAKGSERTPQLVDSFVIENKEVADNNVEVKAIAKELTVKVNDKIDSKAAIANVNDFPENTVFEWKEAPDTSKKGKITAIVIVKDEKGNILDEVEVTINVEEKVSDKDNSTNVNVKPPKKTSPSTGDTGVIIPVAFLALALGSLIIINNKKEKQNN